MTHRLIVVLAARCASEVPPNIGPTDKFRFLEENERVIQAGGRPATAQPLLLGITKASLSTDEDLDLDREIEYAFDADEPMAGRAPSGDVE